MAGRHDSRAYEQSLAQRIEALGLAGKVEMRFEIPDQEKYDLLSSARVLALPSHLEGFGIVVLEANARGAPVVASSGVPESAVRDGYNGLRYQFGDVKALAERLVQVLTDDALHARLSTNGRAFAEQFSWASVGARFEALLKLTIEQKAARKQRPPHKNGD